MNDGDTAAQCCERGEFVTKAGCYALRRPDGAEFWLELDRIPMHLIDQPVQVEGTRFPPDLIAVTAIGPA